MNASRISIDFLTFFQELIAIDFDEKSALEHIKKIHKPFKAQCNFIINKLHLGYSFYQILSFNAAKPWIINCDINNLNLSKWLSYKINYLKEVKEFLELIKKIIYGPSLLLLSSIILNFYLVLFFIPKILLLLRQFNATIPPWILFLESNIIFFKLHGLLFLVILICSFIIFKKFIFQLFNFIFAEVYTQLFVIDLFSIISPLINENIGFKTIIKNISISKNILLIEKFQKFKDSILNNNTYEESFSYLINNQAFIQIIIQSIATNKLQYGLDKVSLLYRKYHKIKLLSVANVLKIISFIFLGINILIGFYLTLLPMNQILSKLIL